MVKIFQQPPPEDSDTCVDLLVKHLEMRLQKNVSSVLILEDAHDIDADAINELLNYVDQINDPLNGELRVLMIADPEIERTLPELTSQQLRDGKVFVSNIRTLDKQRTQDYIEHRLRQAGYSGDSPFSRRDIDEIFSDSDGLPQKVDEISAKLLNKNALRRPIGERLQGLPLRTIAGAAVVSIIIALVLFLFTGESSAPTARTPSSEQTVVELAPTVISEQDDAVVIEGTPSTDTPPTPTAPDDDTATITLLSELESPPNNQFVDSHGVTPKEDAKTPKEKVAKPQPEPEAPAPEPAPAPTPATPDTDEKFLLASKPSLFTVQLLASYDRDEIVRYAKKHGIVDKSRLFRTVRNGRRWHVLAFGLYASAETARAAITRLPADLQRNTPWIRSVKSVQDAIKRVKP
ncbi:MAG: SPOR domain-containing protein [Pseudomonadota bacterium]